MKLLIIHNKYQSSNIGGEDIVYKNELESLQKILGKENVFSYEVSNDEINKFKLLFTIWFSKEHFNAVKKLVKKHEIDIVHAHNFFPLLTPSIFKAAKDTGAKVVHTLHNYRLWCISGILYRDDIGLCEQCTKNKFSLSGIFHKCYRKSLSQSIVAQLSFWFYKIIRVFENIDYFFVLTDFQKEKVISLGIDEKKVILKPNSLKMSFDIVNEKKDYIYVGRLEKSKGIYELLKVWEQLDDKFILIIIGGGGEREEELKDRYNQKNIIFKGKCSREETLEYISKSRYLIQPSLLYETFGLTIMEAMSFGIPIIGFDIGTRTEFISDGKNGFLCNRDNLREKIESSLDFEEYNKLSQNALKTVRLYENEYIIEKQIKIYKNILGNKL